MKSDFYLRHVVCGAFPLSCDLDIQPLPFGANSPIKFGMIDGITSETRQEANYQGFFPSLHEMLVWLAMIQPAMPLFEGVKDRERWK